MPAGRSRGLLVIPILITVSAVVLGVVAVLTLRHPDPVADVSVGSANYGSAPSYVLTDQDGRAVSSASLRGKVQVVSFLFPYCTTYCPIIGRNLVLLDQQLAARHLSDRVDIISFNVDPAGAGPVQMGEFLQQYGANPSAPNWQFLTGTPAQIQAVVRDGFHVYYNREPGAEAAPKQPNPLAQRAHIDYDISHNDVIEVVGPDGRIRKIFGSGSQVSPGQLLAAAEQVLR